MRLALFVPAIVRGGVGWGYGVCRYFANSVSKSAGYCFTEESKNSRALLMLCEVALGEPDKRTNAHMIDPKALGKKGLNSVHGVGIREPRPSEARKLDRSVAVPSGTLQPRDKADPYTSAAWLQYDEFIVYNVAQQRPRFLVEVDIQYK